MSATPDETPNSSSRVVPPEAAARVFESALDVDAAEAPGSRIGPYKLLEEIGEGGFGVVWMAEQVDPIRRRVALKIIKSGMDTREVIARFEAERQAIALMDHPNIARVFDAGATDAGRPYFVMELVRGVPITRYCDEQRLTAEARLKLFISVCNAVQHAHQKGVIHRDLKPSNILVTLNDGTPVPKVIDFGIAKATGGTLLTDKTVFTRFHSFIGTPAYTSPEQMEMSSLDVDTRSDVYSLGVLLYELLAGRPPFDPDTLARSGLDAMRRTICEVDPPRPSARLGTFTSEEGTTIARLRSTEPDKLSLLLRGDLDWIVMRCLEKKRDRRYETVNGLARDIERHLANEPVVARPPSAAYRLRKFVRRHKAAVAATTAVVAALLAGLVTSSVLLVREHEARADAQAAQTRAQIEATRSARVASLMKQMLDGVGSQVAMGRDTKLLRAIVDDTAERVRRDLVHEPAVSADLLETLGLTYGSLAMHETAEQTLRNALELRESLHGRESLHVARLWHEIAMVMFDRSGWFHAEEPLRQALAIQERLLGPDNPDLVATRANLGWLMASFGSREEGFALLGAALDSQHRNSDVRGVSVARTLKLMGKAVMPADPKKSEAYLREALEAVGQPSISDMPELISIRLTLGFSLRNQKQSDEAEQIFRSVLEECRLLFAPGHQHSLVAMLGLGLVLADLRRLEEAESILAEATTLVRRGDFGGDAVDLYATLYRVLREQAKHEAAEELARDNLAHARKLPGNPMMLAAHLAYRTRQLLEERRYTEAEPIARECLAIRQSADTWGYLLQNAHCMLGDSLAGQGRFQEAEMELLAAHEGLVALQREQPSRASDYLSYTLTSILRLYTSWNRPAEVERWRDRGEQLVQVLTALGGPQHAQELRKALAAAGSETSR